MARRLVVLGLDCADPGLVFGDFRSSLTTLPQLMAAGTYGVLRSCIPPITVPAWAVMMSGRDPGELGLYGFRGRAPRSYQEGRIATTGAVRAPRIWDQLSAADRPSVIVGVPPSYPVYPIKGTWVGCFLTPKTGPGCCHPAGLQQRLDGYMYDVTEYRTNRLDELRRQLWEMTTRRFELLRNLIRTEPWHLFAFVEIGIDRVQHAFWRYFDPLHRHYAGRGNPYCDVIGEYYQLVDAELGRLLSGLDDINVAVVSDHGVRRMDGGFCVNEWLRDTGYLRLKDEPAGLTDLSPEHVDWSKTTVWGSGGYYARLHVNVRGREPDGIVPPADLDAVIACLRQDLCRISDPAGNPLPVSSYRPGEVYAAVTGSAPDLMVFLGDLSWRAASKIGTGTLHLQENDTGPDGANHSYDGLYIFTGPDLPADGPGPLRHIASIRDELALALNL